jgi:uncharacterized protein with von Willebrand factor type A (vWA) domain
MKSEELVEILTRFEKRLGALADQAREAYEQARHVVQRIELFQRDLLKLKQDMLGAADTGVYPVQPKPKHSE